MAESTTLYYRLWFVATNSTSSFSPVVVVDAAPVAPALVPNPNAGRQLRVLGLEAQQGAELRLYDLQGRLHFQAAVSGAEINLPALPPGLYVAQLSTAAGASAGAAAGASATVRYTQH